MVDKLAIFGGSPVISEPFKPYPSIGKKEEEAVVRVVRSGELSAFFGSDGPQFLGGREILAFEAEWCERFRVKHTISVNSATSGLFAAVGAVGAGPGDEIIVPPTTMSATAMAPLVYGATPVFADIEDDTFCLDVESVIQKITDKTKAIIAVNLFGHPANLSQLRKIADERSIFLIEDNAQGPLASENGVFAGTIGHIGVFSLNYHKHIHTGEGGMCVTNDPELALRLQLIRNHGENIVESRNLKNLKNIIGFNYRMTELSAAVGRVQLADIDSHVNKRINIAQKLSKKLCNLTGITTPMVRDQCNHVYYVWALKYDEKAVGPSRKRFSDALTAEGFPNTTGYIRPLYMLPIFREKIAMAKDGLPFTNSEGSYHAGSCPVAERLWEKEFLYFEPCAYDLTENNVDALCDAFIKVYSNRHLL
ncbi:MAG: DegT/DnrJ/EryC1/StrS family aminotransferase [Burkholderiales bacterium]|nr:DegT/DnrJ/EryC1/StrS family aminotransferase [Burkholderiales bacterium]